MQTTFDFPLVTFSNHLIQLGYSSGTVSNYQVYVRHALRAGNVMTDESVLHAYATGLKPVHARMFHAAWNAFSKFAAAGGKVLPSLPLHTRRRRVALVKAPKSKPPRVDRTRAEQVDRFTFNLTVAEIKALASATWADVETDLETYITKVYTRPLLSASKSGGLVALKEDFPPVLTDPVLTADEVSRELARRGQRRETTKAEILEADRQALYAGLHESMMREKPFDAASVLDDQRSTPPSSSSSSSSDSDDAGEAG